MEIQTIQKYIHTSPRKLRLVADMVRKMSPPQAAAVLQVTPKAAAKDLQKAIGTVLANAKQQGLDVRKVNFKKIEINESAKMRRFKAGTRGRVKPFKRRMSHIKIVLSDQTDQKNSDSRKVNRSENQSSGLSDNSDISGVPSPSEFSEKETK